MGESAPQTDTAELFRTERKRLWGLAYRITGDGEEASDVVQESFARLLQQSADEPTALTRQWLARVATNLAIDALRKRKRRAYPGEWLPMPVQSDDDDWIACCASDTPDPETRYGLLESASYAFLIALEKLSPRQRGALLLRDVVGYSAAEAADVLGTSAGNVRVLHLRARAIMQNYDAARGELGPDTARRQAVVLARFMECLRAQDVAGVQDMLAESVRTITDAGGEYTALNRSLVGRHAVARLYLQAARNRQDLPMQIEMRLVNGAPALLIRLGKVERRQAPVTLLRIELDAEDHIRAIHSLMANRKLRALLAARID
jgi:RNA polymerase sigma-70 factor (ECF subfamily)